MIMLMIVRFWGCVLLFMGEYFIKMVPECLSRKYAMSLKLSDII
jgi:hypothetical protein